MPRLFKIMIASVLLAPFPVAFTQNPDGTWVFGVEYAYADKDSDDDDDRDDDDDDDRDDRDDDDDDDDRDDRDDRNDDDDDDDDRSNDRGSRERGGNVADLHLRYPNGWDEQIRNGRYVLTDPQGRTVSNRRATVADLNRMRSAAGL